MYTATAFISKREAQEYHEPILSNKRVLISLTTPGEADDRPHSSYCKPAVLHDDTWKDVLRLQFHDKDPNHTNPEEACGYRLFSDQDAIKILNFLKLHQEDCKEAIVHCEAGISRSAAVAKFISIIYSLRFPENYSVYNKHVFSTLMRIYGESLYGDGPLTAENLPGNKGV